MFGAAPAAAAPSPFGAPSAPASALGGGSLFGAAVAPPADKRPREDEDIEAEIPEGAPNVTIDIPPGAKRFKVTFWP